MPKLVPFSAVRCTAWMIFGGRGEDGRSPCADVIDVLVAVHVPDAGAARFSTKNGLSAHGAKGAHGRIHAPGMYCNAWRTVFRIANGKS